MPMHTAVLTCIYPGAENFVPDFIESLSGQSQRTFTLLVLNDGVADCERLFQDTPFATRVVALEGTPAKIRKAGIEWLSRNDFDAVVFADIDDRFEANRVEMSVSLLEKSTVVFNELVFFGTGISEESMFGGRFSEGDRFDASSILTCNFLGLSNTAALVQAVAGAAAKTSDDVIAFDWALFSRVLTDGQTAIYTSKTCTYYRQHGANIAAPRKFSENDILRGLTVKTRHYKALSDLGGAYRELGHSFAKLNEIITSDSAFASLYFSTVRAKSPARPLWWETICAAEELYS